ncbi:geranylgeranyl pyrophosphate synthase [Corynebacterium sphenisci DSM 44792]|uniref:Geranylgeranyl pyrophosphate synthase n=1 Tax=Corynebacterium sphenisci DSM 44792 TaxID=1437874 RepID=A0A1L7CYR4_9CORY|nr:polyprenyl synthetase family protein [Corynebacterium sphenisci]APT90970.1 geranylgeranyl pyrophosphate synthase [Corynebacterium sphenisci DSM 44792]
MPAPRISPGLAPGEVPGAVTEELRDFLESRRAAVARVDPRFTAVFEALAEFTLEGGKRVRPAFAWAGWLGAGGAAGEEDPAAVFRALCALELVQACALIHDDIIDASDTRRGRPTVHRRFELAHANAGWRGDAARYGQAIAIIAGDVALAWSDDLLHESGLSAAALARARRPWSEMRTEVLGGQVLDITAENSGEGGVAVAERINLFKTAAYTVERPLHIGAAIAGAGPEIIDAYRVFGREIGIAFQLRDDQLGVFGDAEVTGKPAGDDLREGKRTVLVATALDRLAGSDPAAARELDSRLGRVREAADIDRLTRIIVDSGAAEAMEAEIAERTRRALASLGRAPIEPAHRGLLERLAHQVTVRSL